MGRKRWDDLSWEVHDGVERQLGAKVEQVHDCPGTADFSGVVHTKHGAVFVKAVSQDEHSQTMARAEEQRLNKLLPDTAPRLLWFRQNMNWAITGYEYVPGRCARLRPGSGDVRTVVKLLADLAVPEVKGSSLFESLGARWAKESSWRTLSTNHVHKLTAWDRENVAQSVDMELYVCDVLSAGTGIAHGDMSELNILVDRNGFPRIVGWTWAARSPAWVDAAIVAVRLVEAGYAPEEAESIVSAVPAWAEASATSLDAFAVALLGRWILKSRQPSLTDAARWYAQYRLYDAPGAKHRA
ncbi:hypothetical protein [Amycolatopsis dendrobii]|uniref:Aminoglycoside phosphotransferase domain-containing protein n=1 Tax=Amycolatopsis dendrobii TaxID=2760662 RepID=A0A7W3VV02_9PSEU|nr:hypothetical protein [Amycolatopsis dendrobii]MBB1153541.1 hypothetical protein [Amycolatopsis dendrobii]